jgi:GDP/UDP-N,N'-diacetylbacillosamine 2-epimerase (hydrolysing)
MPIAKQKRICFVTGTRAEFGLMQSVLHAIENSKNLKLQIVVTGMHLDPKHGKSISRIIAGWKVNAVVPWQGKSQAQATGSAIVGLTKTFEKLRPDIVILVGDRVEGLAAATAAHLSGIAVAHVHGGDRALGQVDDSLRHAITKLSHLHFPATKESARRIEKLGEDRWRIHQVGSPGIDGIRQSAASWRNIAANFPGLARRRYALLALHPVDADEKIEFQRAQIVLRGVLASGVDRVAIIYPNNDPGSGGIIRCWEKHAADPRLILRRDVDRATFLGLLRDAAFLAGNSSAGIIEAASFGTPVIDIGPRQLGRQRCEDVRNVPYRQTAVAAACKRIWNNGHPSRSRCRNVYQGRNTAKRIAQVLGKLVVDHKLLGKLIAY